MTGHPVDELVAYVLGSLPADERRAVDAHLDGCAACRAEAATLAETAWEVAATVARDAPPRLRDAIVARARADAPAIRPAPLGRAIWGRLAWPVPAVVPAALAALLLVALAALAGARQDTDRYARLVSAVAGAQVTALAPTAAGPLRGSLVVPADGTTPYLILDLPAPPAGKTWEAWVIHADVPVRAGVMNGSGLATLALEAPLRPGDTVAITAEPAGGVDRPTGSPVLAGRT